jgi:predicted outer membrane repeat protein
MMGSLFVNNWGRYGGAITVGTMSFISIINSTFINNHALFGSAIYIPLFATYKIDNCTLLDNDGVEGDSGITVIFAMDESYTFNTYFKNNYVYGPGSAVGLWMANMVIENCTFDTNPNYNNDTTSVYLVAGIVKVRNSVFFNNFTSPLKKLIPGTVGNFSTDNFYNYYVDNYLAPLGGFIYVGVDSNYLINNCTFTNGMSKLGGAIYVTSAIGQSNITNCLFTNNTASESGGALFLSFSEYI